MDGNTALVLLATLYLLWHVADLLLDKDRTKE